MPPHIALPEGIPGIGSAFAFRPSTAAPMRELAHVLLFEPGDDAGLPSRDRELIAAYVSSLNDCYFCQTSHGASAAAHRNGTPELVDAVCADADKADISPKLRALLTIAGHVRDDPKSVTPALVKTAKDEGATDLELHDAVLIAAAFCMFNRYVDGLATWQPRETELYRTMGQRLATIGYIAPVKTAAQPVEQDASGIAV